MPRLTSTLPTLLFAFTLMLLVSAGPVPPASPVVSLDVAPSVVVDAVVVPPLPSIAFTLGPRPASDPLPLPTTTKVGGFVPPEMDWLS
ncbi:hypothetical protein PYCCODRAFT_1480508 [Trametes coccinea BRFM310]|uniref:Secreted protein n=1 Tax=Trametes coccinea (strain BRFM310) TaxID=1353009 RepID=A0A1Y2IBV2_TRAC3|nr:hypothetical protein PYCCODRAFT_1480508 [Trametes coccinea BRFM310]